MSSCHPPHTPSLLSVCLLSTDSYGSYHGVNGAALVSPPMLFALQKHHLLSGCSLLPAAFAVWVVAMQAVGQPWNRL